ncbi:dipeptidyl peptidase 2-like [Hydractinia symbiolongicarpus]|uniref:dipeptidyl peptidase 2-like n=1 Tax=Hydractinia symbiolongicarpus TaxID=13093 RepID=UPI00254C5AAB|nr:dipeptidyl peptidase 2-like [Hydractinia symbiolongicarpus]
MKFIWFSILFVQCSGSFSYLIHDKSTEQYEEKFFDQYIDHFNYLGQAGANGMYKQRYLISDKYWTKGSGPVLFYTGNEGDIVNFWVNTGFVFELAQKLKGLVVFGEHRYYGKSLPFGNVSLTPEYIGFLSMEQALADYAVLVKFVQKDMGAQNCSVFSFGGSYGGLLTGYMRYKYPHIISGGVASSAPFFTIAGNRPRSEFFEAVTETFRKSDPSCPASVQEGFSALMDLFNAGAEGLTKIEETFHLCPGQFSKKYIEKNVLAWARNAFTLLAMVDYPYPAKFMADLPGHPVNLACSYMTGKDKLAGLANITQLLYGSKVSCHDTYSEYVACSDPTGCGTGPDAPPWDYQACTEMILPGGSNNKTDMFPPLDFTLDMRRHYCTGKWGLGYSRLDWIGTNYFNSPNDVKKASRIIFPNGDLDPWMPGGVLENLSDSLIAVLVVGGAHHLDLRASNPADPPSVIQARETITKYIVQWMAEDEIYRKNKQHYF